jgi:hypothetical protein
MENQLVSILNAVSGSTIARIDYTTLVATAAKFKGVEIKKNTVASVILFGSQKSAINAYERRVKKTASEITENDSQSVDNFELSDNWHIADGAYSVRKHREKADKQYLFPMFCRPSIVSFTIDGKPATRLEVAEYLTPSARKTLLDTSGIVENKKNGIKHKAIVRTIDMQNINQVKIKKTILTK